MAAEVRDYLGRWEVECSTNSLRTPTIGKHPRQASRHRQSTGESRRLERRMGESRRPTSGSARTGAACATDGVRCAGFVGDVGNWQKDRYHNAH